jgi:hypothetical protein
LDLDLFFNLDTHAYTEASAEAGPSNQTPHPHFNSAEDKRDKQRLDSWTKLFDNINEALQIGSMIIECLNTTHSMSL